MASPATAPSRVAAVSAPRGSRWRTKRTTRRASTFQARSDGGSENVPKPKSIPSRRDTLLATALLACAPVFPALAADTFITEIAPGVASSAPKITEQVFFDLAVDGEFVGKVIVGVYGEANKIASARFLALANGIQGLGYKRSEINAVEYDEDPTTGMDTPSFLGSTGIRAFVIPGSNTPVTDLPGGPSADKLLPELERKLVKHDVKPFGIVSLVVERGTAPPPAKERLVSMNGKFVTVRDPPPPGPNGTAFTVTVAPGAGELLLDRTNVVVGEVVSGFDVLQKIADLPTVKDNSASPFFAVAKQIGDKRATVAEQAFGKPFAKVTVMKCGVVAKNSLQLETTEAVADDAPIAAND